MGFIKRTANYFRNDLRLSSKLLISHLALIVVSSVAIATFFGSSIYDLLISTTIDSKQQTAFATAVSVEAVLDNLINSTDHVADACNQVLLHDMLWEKDASIKFDSAYLANEIYFAAGTNVSFQIYVSQDYIDCFDVAELELYVQSLESVHGTYWYSIVSTSPETTDLFCPSLYLSAGEIERYGDLAYVHKLNHPLNDSAIGYVVAYFSQEPIIDALIQNLSVSQGASYIINSRDALVCDSDSELVGAYYINNEDVDRIVSNGGITSCLGEDIIVDSYSVKRTDWKVVSIFPKAEAVEDAKRATMQFFLFYGTVAVFSALMAIVLTRSISRRIASVVHQMGRTGKERPQKITSYSSAKDEVGQLVVSYNSMVDALNDLMDKNEEAAKTLRLSEFKALQAQINPHFLYNSLDTINWLAKAGESEQVSNAIQTLGRFYKLTLSKNDTFGTVRKEIEHAVLYVQLQNMRYENRIRFVVDIDENIQDCVMPNLVFQPLVENAIVHGIMERERKAGEVLLAGWRDGNDLLFLLSDDGIGMSPEQLKKMMRPDPSVIASAVTKTSSHIGVYNTHERLRLYYGPDYGLSYTSTPGVGTEVQIRMPFSSSQNLRLSRRLD